MAKHRQSVFSTWILFTIGGFAIGYLFCGIVNDLEKDYIINQYQNDLEIAIHNEAITEGNYITNILGYDNARDQFYAAARVLQEDDCIVKEKGKILSEMIKNWQVERRIR